MKKLEIFGKKKKQNWNCFDLRRRALPYFPKLYVFLRKILISLDKQAIHDWLKLIRAGNPQLKLPLFIRKAEWCRTWRAGKKILYKKIWILQTYCNGRKNNTGREILRKKCNACIDINSAILFSFYPFICNYNSHHEG